MWSVVVLSTFYWSLNEDLLNNDVKFDAWEVAFILH